MTITSSDLERLKRYKSKKFFMDLYDLIGAESYDLLTQNLSQKNSVTKEAALEALRVWIASTQVGEKLPLGATKDTNCMSHIH